VTQGVIDGELGALISNHLHARHPDWTVIFNMGIQPRVRADDNFRVPPIAITCTGPHEEEEYVLSDPLLVVEIYSPSSHSEAWRNVWAYATVPSIREILLVNSAVIGAQLLRRDALGNWPERALVIEDRVLELESIELRVPLAAIYQGTRLAREVSGDGAV
jgi:Uma2 family endonuclease